jgi:transcriptional regulator with XRE-family HTH domain
MGDADVVPISRRGDEEVEASREPLLRDVVGDLLRHERTAQQRTLRDVADAAQVSTPYLSEVERGRKEASSEVLGAVCRSLGLSLADLVGRAHRELVLRVAPAHEELLVTSPLPARSSRGSDPVLLAA